MLCCLFLYRCYNCLVINRHAREAPHAEDGVVKLTKGTPKRPNSGMIAMHMIQTTIEIFRGPLFRAPLIIRSYAMILPYVATCLYK